MKLFCYGTLTRGLEGRELTEMALLSETGALAFTDGVKGVSDPLVMRRALSYARTFDLLIVQHPEEERLADDGVMNEGEVATRLGLAGIPAVAEVMAVERDLRILSLTGGRYHAAIFPRPPRSTPSAKPNATATKSPAIPHRTILL